MQQAATELEQAVTIDPAYAAAHYHLGIARHGLGDQAGAAAALTRAIGLAGDPAPAWLADARRRLEQARPP